MSLDRQIQFFELHYKRHPDSRFFIPLADLYRRSGRIDRALELIAAGCGHCPDSLAAAVVRGLCLQDSGRPDEAGREFRRVLERDPGNLIALGHLADVAVEKGDWPAAIELLEKIGAGDPRNEVVAEALANARRREREPEAPAGADGPAAGSGTAPALPASGPSLIAAAARMAGPQTPRPAEPEAPEVQPAPAAAEPPRPEAEAGPVAEGTPAAEDAPAAEEGPESAESPAPDAPAAAGPQPREGGEEAFATRTMADIYLAQGHPQKALRILHRILEQDPGRQDVRDEIALLEGKAPAAARVESPAREPRRNAAERRNRERFSAWLDRESTRE